MESLTAADGRHARDNGTWGREKLAFLDRFAPAALTAAQSKRTRVYLDLFAGPGVNLARGSSAEFDGSPLRALTISVPAKPPGESRVTFTHAWFVNRDSRDHAALVARVTDRQAVGRVMVPARGIRCWHHDANEFLPTLLDAIHPKSYLFVFADMEAPRQLPWTSVEMLRRRRGHESVDLYMLFPLDMALKRLLPYRQRYEDQHAEVLTTFYGDATWRRCREHRVSDAHRHAVGRCLLDAYLMRLRTLWRFADVVADIRRGRKQRLYQMLFATDHPAAERIARGAGEAARRDQQPQLGLEF